jgi:hypothetical protein
MTDKELEEGRPRPSSTDRKHLPHPPADKAIHGPQETKALDSSAIAPQAQRRRPSR